MTARHRKVVIPYSDAPVGTCRWCGDATEPRRNWHPACVKAYQVRAWPGSLRNLVYERDGGRCAHCPADTPPLPRRADPPWAADHIVPLADGGSHDPENAQLLCGPHHAAKTAAEATARAARRRGQAAPVGTQVALSLGGGQ